jgi:hypothetical protein
MSWIVKQERNGVWVPEDGDSCHKTEKIDRTYESGDVFLSLYLYSLESPFY